MFHIHNTLGHVHDTHSKQVSPIHDASGPTAVAELIKLLLSTPRTLVDREDLQVLVIMPHATTGMVSFAEEDESNNPTAVHRFIDLLGKEMGHTIERVRFELERSALRPDELKRAFAKTFGVESSEDLQACERLKISDLACVLDHLEREKERPLLRDALIAYLNDPNRHVA